MKQNANLLKQVAADKVENSYGYVRKDGTVLAYTSITLPHELKKAFQRACYKHGIKVSEQMRLMMQDFITSIKES